MEKSQISNISNNTLKNIVDYKYYEHISNIYKLIKEKTFTSCEKCMLLDLHKHLSGDVCICVDCSSQSYHS